MEYGFRSLSLPFSICFSVFGLCFVSYFVSFLKLKLIFKKKEKRNSFSSYVKYCLQNRTILCYHYPLYIIIFFFSFLLFGQFDGCLIFSLSNEYFLKNGNEIY